MTEHVNNMLKMRSISIKYALEGMTWAFKSQANYRIHFFFSIAALIASYVLHISYVEFLVILMLIFIGIMVEAINTAIELTTDAIDKQWRTDIKLAKDVSAGAMLIFSFGALIIAGIIFIPKLIALIN
ncbi:diacylglycerol kinase family protein [Candidatus Microgenomates bacterium]|nr:diacylglycerol kinase family protein [Candidatus Microgenomates bacterium]